MLTKKKKLSRKEIKEDKLVETYYKTLSFFEDNKQRVLLYAGVLAAVIVGVYFYSNYQKENNIRAGEQLARIMQIYDAGNYLEAIEGRQGTDIVGLKQIVEEYGGTENGETAKIYLANSYNFLGKFDEALNFYKDYSGDNDLLEAAALAGEAGIYASTDEHEKAADLYRKASQVFRENVNNSEYLLKAAVNYIEAGDNEEAKNLLERIKEDYTGTTAFREADKYLAIVD